MGLRDGAENIGAEQATFIERLRGVKQHYHDRHPFHIAMHAGALTPEQIRGWVANRYYYQKSIPIKDAAILANLPDRHKRRVWIHRILDHDGTLDLGGGGIEGWLMLARAVGLREDDVTDEGRVEPGTRLAVDAYVTFARTQPWLAAVASSLTELFAPELMSARLSALIEKYPWIDQRGLEYFRTRISQAPRGAEYTLRWVVENATERTTQDACVHALEFKCDVLWAILDATQRAYGPVGRPPV
jgi:pyrroloquinoline-quinone synthase